MAQDIQVKWNGKKLTVSVDPTETVAQIKHKLEQQTHVSAKRQKILGLKTADGKMANDTALVADLVIKPTTSIMLMGTPDAVIEQTQKEAEAAPEIQDDFDIGIEDEQILEVKDRPEVQEKLQRRINSVQVKVLNEPRPGKKCLVLDIDYTLFDLNSSAERPDELARPYLHEFLTSAYQHYDIIIWSATSMKWVEVKMKELGCLSHPGYKISFMLDHAAMVTVNTEKYGVFDCKPLAFIWAKFPDFYNEHNTIMFDDLRRNYIMNKQNGLVIRPFKRAHLTRHLDRELLHLTQYLAQISHLASLAHLKHRHWEEYVAGARSVEPRDK